MKAEQGPRLRGCDPECGPRAETMAPDFYVQLRGEAA
jgi:hypothetical protein